MAHVAVIAGVAGLRDVLEREFHRVENLAVCRWRILALVGWPENLVCRHFALKPAGCCSGVNVPIAALIREAEAEPFFLNPVGEQAPDGGTRLVVELFLCARKALPIAISKELHQ